MTSREQGTCNDIRGPVAIIATLSLLLAAAQLITQDHSKEHEVGAVICGLVSFSAGCMMMMRMRGAGVLGAYILVW